MSYGLTVTVTPAETPPTALAVIEADPTATAVTRPDAFTDTTSGLLLLHVRVTPGIAVLPEYTVAVSCIPVPVPTSVGVVGLTVIVAPRTPRST